MNSQNASLVIVEDNPADMTAYLRLLEDTNHGFEHIECITTLESAKQCFESEIPPACCLLDFNLPDGSALSFLEEFESDRKTIDCPIVVITGQDDTKNAVRLLKLGIQDYLVKDDLTSHHLMQTIKNAIQKWEMKKQLEEMALHDSLTGLANRRLFVEKLEQTFNESRRYSRAFSLLLLDVDKFKTVNDIYGHDAGDFVLQAFTQKVLNTIRVTDIFGRLGGDEFALILPDTNEDDAIRVAEKIQRNLCMDVKFNNSIIPTGSSIGLTSYPSKANDTKALLKEADIALYKAKDTGRNKVVSYKQERTQHATQLESLKSKLAMSIAKDELEIAMQPIFSTMSTNSLHAVEALVRWKAHDTWINPIEIVNMVMELGLDLEFHEWLFTKTFSLLQEFHKSNPSLKLCVNLPANLCHNPMLAELIVRKAKEFNGIQKHVILEVTETHLMIDPIKAKACLCDLVENGFQIAIDDFGTGYSSMEYMAELPCSIVKIDKRFFLELQNNQRNYKIIEAITALAHGLDMQVIAEGIETAELEQAANELQCDFLQGFYKGKPVVSPSSIKQMEPLH
jgi:diguanylate cyclase (GGDEF)-like protein